MAPNRIPEFPYQLAEYLEQSRRTWTTSTTYLGGTSGSGGGAGSPPGGFVGQLVQTRVAYDTSERSTPTTGSFPSLLDNLNHIRWMITSGSYSGIGNIITSGSPASGQVAYWTTGSALGGDPGFTYNPTTDRLTLGTSGSAAGLLLTDVLLYRKSSQKLGVGGSADIDGALAVGGAATLSSTLSVGGVQIDTAGAVINYVLTYNGTKYVGAPNTGGGGGGGIGGVGTPPEIAYFTSGSIIASASGFEYYPGGSLREIIFWAGAHSAGIGLTVESATSGSLADAFIKIQTDEFKPDGGSPYTLWKNSEIYWAAGLNPRNGDFNLNYQDTNVASPSNYIPGRSGTSPVLRVDTSGSVFWSQSKQVWGSSTVQFDSSMRLAPSGATSGSLLGYDGVKWIPMMGGSGVTGIPTDGWIDAGETWTYVSADGPTGVFSVPADVTGKYQPGMRVKYTQSTVKYGIITTTGSYGGGVTNITIYGGTDYTTGSGAITSPYYSPVKAPFGMPMSPEKWTVLLTDTSDRNQASPTADTVYNLGSLSLSIPIGSWIVDSQVLIDFNKAAGAAAFGRAGISTSSSSITDKELVSGSWAPDATSPRSIAQLNRTKLLLLTSKTTYYVVATVNINSTNLDIRGDLATTVVMARSAYL